MVKVTGRGSNKPTLASRSETSFFLFSACFPYGSAARMFFTWKREGGISLDASSFPVRHGPGNEAGGWRLTLDRSCPKKRYLAFAFFMAVFESAYGMVCVYVCVCVCHSVDHSKD